MFPSLLLFLLVSILKLPTDTNRPLNIFVLNCSANSDKNNGNAMEIFEGPGPGSVHDAVTILVLIKMMIMKEAIMERIEMEKIETEIIEIIMGRIMEKIIMLKTMILKIMITQNVDHLIPHLVLVPTLILHLHI